MEQKVQGTLLSPAPVGKKRKTVTEKAPTKKRLDRERTPTRVNIGVAFPRWRKLRETRGLKSDAMLALLLLDRFESAERTTPPTAESFPGRDDDSSVAEIEEVLDDSNQQLDPRDDDISGESDEEWHNSSSVNTPDEQLDESIESEEEASDPDSEAVLEDDETTEKSEQYEDSNDEGDKPSGPVQICDASKKQENLEALPTICIKEPIEKDSHPVRKKPAQHPNDCYEDRSPAEQPSWPCETSTLVQPMDMRLSSDQSPNAVSKRGALSSCEREDSLTDEHAPDPDNSSTSTAETETVNDDDLLSPEESSEILSKKDVENQGPSRAKSYDCLTCGRMFSNSSALRRHLVIHSGKRPYKCFICGRGFTQSGNLKTHMKVHKGEVPNWALIQEKPAPREPHVRAHVCCDCGMDFPNLQQLEEHRDTHKKPYACSECGKTFKNESYFKQHTRMHTEGLAFICSECGKPWATPDLLKKHELTHSTERNFHCDQCGKAFSKPASLKAHLKTHTGERTYLCSVCGKSYSKAHPLKVHLRVHTGERPYTCETCGKGFYYSQGYQKHVQIHDKKPKPPTKPLGRPKQLLLLMDG